MSPYFFTAAGKIVRQVSWLERLDADLDEADLVGIDGLTSAVATLLISLALVGGLALVGDTAL